VRAQVDADAYLPMAYPLKSLIYSRHLTFEILLITPNIRSLSLYRCFFVSLSVAFGCMPMSPSCA